MQVYLWIGVDKECSEQLTPTTVLEDIHIHESTSPNHVCDEHIHGKYIFEFECINVLVITMYVFYIYI